MSVVILGGGLAGLSAAMNLPEKLKGTLFEKQGETGGLLKTDLRDGFRFDHGPHLFFHTDPYFLEIFKKALETTGFVTRMAKTGQFSFKTLVEFPYALHLKNFPKEVVTKCVEDFKKQNAQIAQGKKFSPKNYEEYCRNYFGDGLTDNFMIPYAQKIWTVHPRDLSIEWTGTRIVLPDLDELIKGATTDRSLGGNYIKEFRYPKSGGTQSFVKGVAGLIKSNVEVRTNSDVKEINLSQKKITLADNSSHHYEFSISSLPLPDLLKLVTDLPNEVREAIEKLKWFGVLLLNFASENIKSNEYQWIYFDQQDTCFHRVHYPFKLSDEMAPAGGRSLQTETSFSKFRKLPASEAGMQERAWSELQKTGFVEGNSPPKLALLRRLEYAYAIMDHERQNAVKFIRDYLESKSFITCGRFGEWDYIWTDKVLNSGKTAAEKLVKYSK